MVLKKLSANEDDPNKVGVKIDLRSILIRRNRTVAGYLKQNGVTNKAQLKRMLASLRQDYLISAEFESEAAACFLSAAEPEAGTSNIDVEQTPKTKTKSKKTTKARKSKKPVATNKGS
jgi:hypothetical protein